MAEAFEQAFARAAEILRSCDGCLGVSLLKCVESPGQYHVHVRWISVAHHEQGYGASPKRAEVRGLISPWVESAVPPAHFTPVL